jgi:hypothetical protein
MGEVYEAFDVEHETRVALKVLTTLTSETLLRFKNEIRALHDLEHPNVVSFGELLEQDGRWFFTMEFVDGIDFLSHVRYSESDEPVSSTTNPMMIKGPLSSARNGHSAPPGRFLLSPGYDEPLLRDALKQLAQGVAALHAAGKIHRDIKPSNVRVTNDGRVVLLDFGLVADIEHPIHITGHDQVVGTPAFMAPEQACSRLLGPAADWYSVGVMLYLALTGHLPFNGKPMDMLTNKQRIEPTPPSAMVRGIPPDLDDLCVALLRTDPSTRPTDEQVLHRLKVDATEASAIHGPSLPHTQPFVGRARELARLREHFQRTRTGRAITVYVHGESGVGKTALVRAFTDQIIARRDAVVLEGRCYEGELVPFKAVDGLIDDLSRLLISLPRQDAAALLPAKAALLTQVFPVLRGIEAIAQGPFRYEEVRDPQELRRRAFAAVRELLVRLAERRPVILVIDDMQWSDADSLALLRELLRPPDAPALLLILTFRTDAHEEQPSADELPPPVVPGEVNHIFLERLPLAEAHELAGRLLAQLFIADDELARAIAEEAGGHPLFVDELARRAHAEGGRSTQLLLDEALAERIAHLDGPARRIIEVLAVAGVPLPREVVARAVELEFVEFQKRISILRVAHVVRWSDGYADRIEPYHDRVRDAALARLSSDDSRAYHERLAIALESSARADPEALAVHWRGAGKLDKAMRYALQAADQAASALAFERASHLYLLALELGIDDPVEAKDVRVLLGDTLKNAGCGAAAAHIYLSAAEDSANAAEKLELQRRAAEQLLLSGHVDDGLVALSRVLHAAGMRLPRTPGRALISLVRNRARLRLRGLGFRERDVSQVSAEELTRVDVLWSAAAGLGFIDNVLGADFQCRNLLSALRAGEPHRIARALAIEGGHSSIGAQRTERRTARLLAASEELATRLGDPYALGLHKVVAAMAALMNGSWKRACELSDDGEVLLRARCSGVAWEIDCAQMFVMDALWFLGELRELAQRVPLCITEAQERGDLYAVTNIRTGPPNLVLLVGDAVDEARRQLEEAMARWSQNGVHMQHFRELFALVHLDLYARDGEAALARVIARLPLLGRAQLLRIEFFRLSMFDLRGRAALVAAERAEGHKRETLLAAAGKDARALARGRMSWCRPAAQLLSAGVAAARRDRQGATALLREAIAGFAHADMAMHAAAARQRLGQLLRDREEGTALVTESERWFAGQGVQKPDRLAAMVAPGFVE